MDQLKKAADSVTNQASSASNQASQGTRSSTGNKQGNMMDSVSDTLNSGKKNIPSTGNRDIDNTVNDRMKK